MIYIELCYAIISNYFVIPTTHDSLLTFSPSEPNTPHPRSRRLSTTSNASIRSGKYRHDQLQLSPRSAARKSLKNYGVAFGDGHDSSNYPVKETMTKSPQPPFLGFISGDEGRDFEDLGGWRYMAPSKSRENRDGSVSPTSDPNASDNSTEERAWLSINERLELPSHSLTLGDRTTSEPSNLFLSATTASPTRIRQKRHHRRSRTTSMLFPRAGGGLSLALSNRPDTPSARSTPATPGNPQLMSPRLTGVSQGSDGYFPPQGFNNEMQTNGAGVPRMSDSMDERGLGLGRVMAHYPVSVRHRRRSVSGAPRGLGRDGAH